MSIEFDEKAGKWKARFSKRPKGGGTPVSLVRIGIGSKAEAVRVERELIAEVARRVHRKITPSWSETMQFWEEDARNRGLSGKTIQCYLLSLHAYTLEKWGDRPVDQITTQEVRELVLNDLSDKSKYQQHAVLKFIRCVFQHGVDRGILMRNPAPNMKFKFGQKLKSVLTEPQVRILLNRAKEMDVEWYPHWAVAIYTGMRSGELYALQWDRVDLENRTIKVDAAWNSKDGFKSTKSGDDRIVEIAPPLLTVLRELKMQGLDQGYVLPRNPKWDKGDQARELWLFLSALKLPSIRFHDLRATWATLMLSRGIEPIKVMKMGGWKNLKTVMHYVRLAAVDIKGSTDGLDLHNPSSKPAVVISLKK